jgi:hypothetical protein
MDAQAKEDGLESAIALRASARQPSHETNARRESGQALGLAWPKPARVSGGRRLAERVGFEPTVEFPLHTLSKRARSTTPTSLRFRINGLRAVETNYRRNCVRPPNVPRSLVAFSSVAANVFMCSKHLLAMLTLFPRVLGNRRRCSRIKASASRRARGTSPPRAS